MADGNRAELARIQDIAGRIRYKPRFRLLAEIDQTDPDGRVYLQVECDRPDSITGVMGVGRGGKSYLSPHATLSEIVRRAFGLFAAYEEHECREFFEFDGARVFGPHISVEALVKVADDLDVRSPR